MIGSQDRGSGSEAHSGNGGGVVLCGWSLGLQVRRSLTGGTLSQAQVKGSVVASTSLSQTRPGPGS